MRPGLAAGETPQVTPLALCDDLLNVGTLDGSKGPGSGDENCAVDPEVVGHVVVGVPVVPHDRVGKVVQFDRPAGGDLLDEQFLPGGQVGWCRASLEVHEFVRQGGTALGLSE